MVDFQLLLSRRGEPSRRSRRALVVASGASIALVPTFLAFSTRADLPDPIGLLAFVLPLVLVAIPLLALTHFRRNVIRRGLPDERERQRRDEAYRISYRIIELAVVVGLLAAAVLREQLAAILAYDWSIILWPIYGYLIILPYAVFAWREPDAVD